ncbi:MAG: class II fructose-bisphosphate aldolase [Candidatus Paceibacterota bacterium]
MKTLKEYFQDAVAGKWAIGHFNFSTADQLKAFVEVASEIDAPLMVATSEGESNFVGRRQAVALVKSWRDMGHVVFLNADHHKSWETAKESIDAGYDTVLIDASKLNFEENVALTKKVVDYAKSVNPDMLIEGELGYLRGESQIQEKVEIGPDDYTKPEEAREFVERTGVDRLAIVFGNIHGVVTEQEERLDLEVLKKVAEAIPNTPLVLHGGSGLSGTDVQEAIRNGISNVHINTELRVAYQKALKDQLTNDPEQTTPYKFLAPSYEATKKLIKEKLELFGSAGKL